MGGIKYLTFATSTLHFFHLILLQAVYSSALHENLARIGAFFVPIFVMCLIIMDKDFSPQFFLKKSVVFSWWFDKKY